MVAVMTLAQAHSLLLAKLEPNVLFSDSCSEVSLRHHISKSRTDSTVAVFRKKKERKKKVANSFDSIGSVIFLGNVLGDKRKQ